MATATVTATDTVRWKSDMTLELSSRARRPGAYPGLCEWGVGYHAALWWRYVLSRPIFRAALQN